MISPMFIHYIVALIVIAALIVAVVTPVGRRVALWALALQLLVGLWLIFTGLRPSPWHPALWLFAALFTQAAIFAGRGGRRAIAILLTVLALACATGAFYLGLLGQRPRVSAAPCVRSRTLRDRTLARSAALLPTAQASARIEIRSSAANPSTRRPPAA